MVSAVGAVAIVDAADDPLTCLVSLSASSVLFCNLNCLLLCLH